MFYVNGTNIKLTRGDSASLSVALDGYEMQDGDTLTLSVKVDPNKTDYLLQLTAQDMAFTFLPETTAGLPFGAYRYDIQLETANGEVYTVIPVSSFTIMEEITCPEPEPEPGEGE